MNTYANVKSRQVQEQNILISFMQKNYIKLKKCYFYSILNTFV